MRRPRKLADGRTKPFFWHEMAYIDDGHMRRQGPIACMVYQVLARNVDDSDCAEIGLAALSADTGLDRKTVIKAMRRLVELGYARVARAGGGSGRMNVMQLIDLSSVSEADEKGGRFPQKTVDGVHSFEAEKGGRRPQKRVDGFPKNSGSSPPFPGPPITPSKEEREESSSRENAAAAKKGERAAEILAGLGVLPGTAAEAVKAAGEYADAIAQDALANATDLVAKGGLRGTVSGYVLRAMATPGGFRPRQATIQPSPAVAAAQESQNRREAAIQESIDRQRAIEELERNALRPETIKDQLDALGPETVRRLQANAAETRGIPAWKDADPYRRMVLASVILDLAQQEAVV